MKYECVGGERGGHKLASRAKVCLVLSTPTPEIKYSPTRFWKKLVLPWRLIVGEEIKSHGVERLHIIYTSQQRKIISKIYVPVLFHISNLIGIRKMAIGLMTFLDITRQTPCHTLVQNNVDQIL